MPRLSKQRRTLAKAAKAQFATGKANDDSYLLQQGAVRCASNVKAIAGKAHTVTVRPPMGGSYDPDWYVKGSKTVKNRERCKPSAIGDRAERSNLLPKSRR